MSVGLQMVLKSIPHQASADLQQLLRDSAQPSIAPIARFNASAQLTVPDSCLHELFENHAARQPNARCLLAGMGTLCYGEVNTLADVVAGRLHAHGISVGDVVAVAILRSFELYIALLGVLKAGGICLPLDPDSPQERKALLLSSAGAKQILMAGLPLGQLDSLPSSGSLQVHQMPLETVQDQGTERFSVGIHATADQAIWK